VDIKQVKMTETTIRKKQGVAVTVKYESETGEEHTLVCTDPPRPDMGIALAGLTSILEAEECWPEDYLDDVPVAIVGLRVTKDQLVMIDYQLELPSGSVTRCSGKFSPDSLPDRHQGLLLAVEREGEAYVRGDREQTQFPSLRPDLATATPLEVK